MTFLYCADCSDKSVLLDSVCCETVSWHMGSQWASQATMAKASQGYLTSELSWLFKPEMNINFNVPDPLIVKINETWPQTLQSSESRGKLKYTHWYKWIQREIILESLELPWRGSGNVLKNETEASSSASRVSTYADVTLQVYKKLVLSKNCLAEKATQRWRGRDIIRDRIRVTLKRSEDLTHQCI